MFPLKWWFHSTQQGIPILKQPTYMFRFVSCLTKTIDKLQIIVDTRNSDLFKSEKLHFTWTVVINTL